MTDAGLAHVKKLKNLESLNLASTSITDAGLEHLRECPNLEHLLLSFCQGVTQAGVERMEEALPNLTVEF